LAPVFFNTFPPEDYFEYPKNL
jgi:hypothetical protein